MTKRRFSKEDWIALGLEVLSAEGPEAVKLEPICKSAGLTRGSFYHHFEDHQTFLISLATHWYDTQTTDVAATVDVGAGPDDQNVALTEAAMQIDYRVELGIRELGRRLPAIQKIVKKADAKRLEVISALYQRRHGLNPQTADAFAYLEYAAFSGVILLDPDMPKDRQRELASLYDTTISTALGRQNGT